MRSFILILFLVFSISGVGQQSQMNFSLYRAINESNPDQLITFYVKGDKKEIVNEVIRLNGEYRNMFRGYHSISLPASVIENFSKNTFITDIDFQYARPVLLNDSALVKNNVVPVHQGISPLPGPFTGKGVILGIIDTGIDFTHPDLQDSLGNTRVLYLWDQTITSPSTSPDLFNYGQEWDSTDINNGSCTHDPTGAYGHGTNVAGVAASNGLATGNYKGAAPEAEIIFVASDLNNPNWLTITADAIEYIFAKADSLSRPCVINISAGVYAGSHDGQDLDAQRIDSLLKAKNGRSIVCAAGNSGNNAAFHLGYDVVPDTSFTWFGFNPSANYFGPYSPNGSVFIEIFADTAAFNNVDFSIGADLTSPNYQKRAETQFLNIQGFFDGTYTLDGNGVYNDILTNSSGNDIANVYIGFDLINDSKTYLLQVVVDPDSVTNYNWRFSTTGNGRLDAWGTSASIFGTSDIVSTIPDSVAFPDIVHYQLPDTFQSIVSSFSCLPDVITVGNYENESGFIDMDGNQQNFPNAVAEGELHSSSSLGPNRLGATKPTLAAPGTTTIVAGPLSLLAQMWTSQSYNVAPDSLHRTAGGTSMASPSVAGIVALLFEKCPSFDYADIKTALINSARQDVFTGITPNNFYGYGKADAFTAFLHPTLIPALNYTDSIDVCQAVLLNTIDQFPQQIWSTNATGTYLQVTQNGAYFATVTDTLGCFHITDTVVVSIDPFQISSPALNLGDTTLCEKNPLTIRPVGNYSSYLWSNNAVSDSITTNQTANYHVLVTDVDGCKAYSDTVELIFLINPPQPGILVLSDTVLNATLANSYQWYFGDSLLVSDTSQVMYASDSGYYFVETFHPNGCSTLSDSIYVTLPLSNGISTRPDTRIKVYPNPFNHELYVSLAGGLDIQQIEVINMLGITIKSMSIEHFENPTITKINLQEIPPGMYFLYFRSPDNNRGYKIIKK